MTVADALLRATVKRPGRGRPRCRPKRVIADKGYAGRLFRARLRRRGIRYTIPRKINQCRSGPFDVAIYRERNRIERTFNRLKQWRRIATRYEKRAANYRAMIVIAAMLQWL
jgi:transposase